MRCPKIGNLQQKGMGAGLGVMHSAPCVSRFVDTIAEFPKVITYACLDESKR